MPCGFDLVTSSPCDLIMLTRSDLGGTLNMLSNHAIVLYCFSDSCLTSPGLNDLTAKALPVVACHASLRSVVAMEFVYVL